jgi:hypothetical protein
MTYMYKPIVYTCAETFARVALHLLGVTCQRNGVEPWGICGDASSLSIVPCLLPLLHL